MALKVTYFTGLATMWMAVFADVGATLLAVGNGLRLLRKQEGQRGNVALIVNAATTRVKPWR